MQSPESVDRSRYPVFQDPMSSRGDIATGRRVGKSLQISSQEAQPTLLHDLYLRQTAIASSGGGPGIEPAKTDSRGWS